MESGRIRGLIAAGLITGLGCSFLLFLFEFYNGRRQRQKFLLDIFLLQQSIAELKTELSAIRDTIQKGQDKTDRLKRRRGINRVEIEPCPLESDNDEEFFEFSSGDEAGPEKPTLNGIVDPAKAFYAQIDNLVKGGENDQDESFKLLDERYEEFKSDVHYLYRATNACRLQASRAAGAGDKELQLKFIEKGLALGEAAVKLDPKCAAAHKWYAILLGMRNDFLATKDKIHNGLLFKTHLELALEGRPNDYSLVYLLSRFKYEIANLSWIEKKVAGAIFGALPDITIDEALNDAKRAEDLCKDPWPENRLLIAKCYFALGDHTTGLEWLDKAQAALTELPQNAVAKRDIEKLLGKFSRYRN